MTTPAVGAAIDDPYLLPSAREVAAPRASPFRLLPLCGVEADGDGDTFTARTIEPWLDLCGPDRVRLDLRPWAGRLVEIGYRASLLDQPARPLIRFIFADGSHLDRIAPAPIAGRGFWIGRMPAGVQRVAVSPTLSPGRFGFRIESLRVRPFRSLLAEGVTRRPRHSCSVFLTRLIGLTAEADGLLGWAIGAYDLCTYGDWARRCACPPEPDAIDRPRVGAEAPPIVVLVEEGEGLAATLASLRAQSFPRWRLLLIGGADGGSEDRVASVARVDAPGAVAALPPGSLVARLAPGDVLPWHALAFVAEQRRREPGTWLFYGDETSGGVPVLKPGWSPRLMAALPDLGRAAFARVEGWDGEECRGFVDAGILPARLRADARRVLALRRVLLDAPLASPAAPVAAAPATSAAAVGPSGGGPLPRCALIIPTRDQPARLRRFLGSIRDRSAAGCYRLVIVDNGRDGRGGRSLPAELAGAADITVLRQADAFNFSRFCNEAAAACDEPVLVFLNDDMEVLSEGWLQRLAALALEPDVGAVGAKLTYPDGRLQHVGLVVGMGGCAGHLGALAPGDDPGWGGRNGVVHEVSAVTGACLAVARDKFEAVGGFDAEALPVELGDVDLCLKLNARGWQTLVDPSVHLLHEESASRGRATFRRLAKYSRQRDIFIERWRHVLRDDPFFHPGLSLYSQRAALG